MCEKDGKKKDLINNLVKMWKESLTNASFSNTQEIQQLKAQMGVLASAVLCNGKDLDRQEGHHKAGKSTKSTRGRVLSLNCGYKGRMSSVQLKQRATRHKMSCGRVIRGKIRVRHHSGWVHPMAVLLEIIRVDEGDVFLDNVKWCKILSRLWEDI